MEFHGVLVKNPERYAQLRDEFYCFTNQFEATPKETHPLIADETMMVLVAGARQVIGYCVFAIAETKGDLYLREVFIIETYRGKGVFGKLIKLLEHYAEHVAPGELEQMCLGVHNLNRSAKKAYGKTGFVCRCDHQQCASNTQKVMEFNRYCCMERPIRKVSER